MIDINIAFIGLQAFINSRTSLMLLTLQCVKNPLKNRNHRCHGSWIWVNYDDLTATSLESLAKIECLKLHSSSFSYSLKTCYWLSFSRRLLVPSCCFRCVMAGVQPYAMPADVCSLLAEAQRNVLPQSHRARSMSSCCVKTLRARSRFSRFFFSFFFWEKVERVTSI